MKLPVEKRPIRVPGYRFAGIHCGLKESGRRDLALMVSDCPATAAGVFTTNRVQAAPVVIGRERLKGGVVRAILVNSGTANALTGASGERAARTLTALAARELGVPEEQVIPGSTGRIGVGLPLRRLRPGVRRVCAALDDEGFHDAHEGIMTTDAFPKFAYEEIRIDRKAVTVAAMAKGAGMIAPRMATMLAYVFTDAAVSRAALRAVLREQLPHSLNAIVVDGDMSTNDTVIMLANGVAGNRPLTPRSPQLSRFSAAVGRMLHTLARQIVLDGEGATRLVEIEVRGARSTRDAERAADAVARSPLCKTAFHGGDPYAGRIVCALGYSGARFDLAKLDVSLGRVAIVRSGRELVGHNEERAAREAAHTEVSLRIDFHAGAGRAYRLASDLTCEYVRFNADYRT